MPKPPPLAVRRQLVFSTKLRKSGPQENTRAPSPYGMSFMDHVEKGLSGRAADELGTQSRERFRFGFFFFFGQVWFGIHMRYF
jgi:hypothetical protein